MNGSILVVEDEQGVLSLVCNTLAAHGYKVLEAHSPLKAASILGSYTEPIHMLLTDVVMPHVRGPEVARRLSANRRDMKVIFMSGYTEGAFGTDDGDKPGPEIAILQKPFELDSLALKIREVLEARTRR